MRGFKQQIARDLAELQRDAPPESLRRLETTLNANYVPLDGIYALGISPAGYGEQADRLAGASRRLLDVALAEIDAAGRVHSDRAARVTRQSRIGAAGAIVILMLAFLVLYRQNSRLLAASRSEALVDPLTGLSNRRALTRDLDAALVAASAARPLTLALFDLDGFKRYNDTFGHPAGDALLARLGERLVAVAAPQARAYRIGGDEFCVLTAAGDFDGVVRACSHALSESGETFNVTCSYGLATAPFEVETAEAALRLADQRLYEEKAGRRSENREVIDVLRKVMSERGAGMEQHLTVVARSARLIARQLGLSNDEADRIQLAGMLHDVGKTAIPDSLLCKPARLTEEEWQFMRTHTLVGERIVLAAPSLAHTAELVRRSHECMNGSGYPDGLAGEEIPLGSRILLVCDAYDAMTNDRPYRRAISPDEALAKLRCGMGTQFDPRVVEAFCELAAAAPAALARAA